MYVGSALACSVQNSAMPLPDAVVAESRARVAALAGQVQSSFAAMNRAVNRPGSDLADLGLLSRVDGFNPPAPYGTGVSDVPPGVSPNNGGGGADTEPQAPYVTDPWPVGLPAAVCAITPQINGQPASPVFAAPLTASAYRMPASGKAPSQNWPTISPPFQPAAVPPGPRAESVQMSALAAQYKAANAASDKYQAEVRAAIAAADPGGTQKVEVVYPGQAPGSPRYAAGYGSPPGTQPAVYVGGRLVMPARVLPAPGLPMSEAQGLRGLGCDECGGGGFLVSFLGSLAAAGAVLVAAHFYGKGAARG